MADLLHKLRKYKAYLKVHPDGDKVLPVLQKLSTLPMSIATLQETGIGKVVSGFRKQGGDVGDCAKSLVAHWKDLVTSEAKLKYGGDESGDERGDESKKDNNGSDVEEDVSARHGESNSDDEEQEHEAAEYSEKEEEPYADGSDNESERGSASIEGSGSPDYARPRQSESEEEENDGPSCYAHIEAEDNSDESEDEGHRNLYQTRQEKDNVGQRFKAEKNQDRSSSGTREQASPRIHIHGEVKEKHRSSHKFSSSSAKQHYGEAHKSNHSKHRDADHCPDMKHSSHARAADKQPAGHKNSSSKSSQKEDRHRSLSSKLPQTESEAQTSTSHHQKMLHSKSDHSSSQSSKSRDQRSDSHHKAESCSSAHHSKSHSNSHHSSSASKHKSLSSPSASVNKHLSKPEFHQLQSHDSSGSKNKTHSSKTTSSSSIKSKDEKIAKVDSGLQDHEKSSKHVQSSGHKHSSGKDLLPRKSHSSTNKVNHRADVGQKQDKERQKHKKGQTSSWDGQSKTREEPRSQPPGQASKPAKNSSQAERDFSQASSGNEEEDEMAESCDDYEEYIDRWVEDGTMEYNPSAVKPKNSKSKIQSASESERSQSIEDYEEYISKQAARASPACAKYTPGPVNKKADENHSWHIKDKNSAKHGHTALDKNHSSSKRSSAKADNPRKTHSAEYIPTRINKEKGNTPDVGKSADSLSHQKSKSRPHEKYSMHADSDSEQEGAEYIPSPIKREKDRKPVFEVFSGDDDEGHSDKEWQNREKNSKSIAKHDQWIQDEKMSHRDEPRESSHSTSSQDQRRNQKDEKQVEGKIRYDGKIFSEPKKSNLALLNVKSTSGPLNAWENPEKQKHRERQDKESSKSKGKKGRADSPVVDSSKSDRNFTDALHVASSNTKRENSPHNKANSSSSSKQKSKSRPMSEPAENSLFSCPDDHSIKTTVRKKSKLFTASSSKSKSRDKAASEISHRVQGKDSRMAAEGKSSKDIKSSSEKIHHKPHSDSSRDKHAEQSQMSLTSKDRSDKIVSKVRERGTGDSHEHKGKSSKTKERVAADKKSDLPDHSGPASDGFSFEDFMNYDELSVKRKRLAEKIPKPKEDVRRGESVQISPAKEIKITNADILSMLPETSTHYRPLRFHPLDEDRHREKEDIYVDPMLIGSKTTSRTKVYSGHRHGLTEVKSLFDLCIQVLIDNIDAIDYVGGIPFDVLRPVLERTTPAQLFNLENYNHHFLEDTDNLWQAHCERDFRGCEPDEMETWRELYLRKYDEREAKYQKLKTAMSSTITRGQAGRKVRLAFTDTIAKPPRDVLRRQLKYGTAGISRAGRPIPSSNKTFGSSSDGSSIASSSSAGLQHLKDYRHIAASPVALATRVDPFQHNRPKIVPPMMQKTLTMMKKLRR